MKKPGKNEPLFPAGATMSEVFAAGYARGMELRFARLLPPAVSPLHKAIREATVFACMNGSDEVRIEDFLLIETSMLTGAQIALKLKT